MKAEGEQKHEVGLSAGAMRRYRISETRGYYIFIIYTPNLGLGTALTGREREQGRLRGAPREQGGAAREQWASTGKHRGSVEGILREHEAVQGRSR